LHSPYILGDTTRPRHITCVLLWSKSDQRRLRKTLHKQTDRQTDRQTDTTKINNGHLAVNQKCVSFMYVASDKFITEDLCFQELFRSHLVTVAFSSVALVLICIHVWCIANILHNWSLSCDNSDVKRGQMLNAEATILADLSSGP